ncbi:LamG domain-containing protein [bacterium]|nr:LamG domain-containing protein [bacterium]
MKKSIFLLGLILLLAGYSQAADLVGYWNFDEGKGCAANDSSGNKNTGWILGSATWVKGISGSALEFDDKDYVFCKHGTCLALALETFTVEYWYKPGDWTLYPGSTPCAVWRVTHIQKCAPKLARPYCIYGARPGESLYFEMRGDDGVHRVLHSKKRDWNKDTFYHIAVQYDNSDGFWRIYVNGKLDSSKIEKFSPSLGSDEFYIGRGKFKGIIDEVKIYNRVLSEDEIKEHYEEGSDII